MNRKLGYSVLLLVLCCTVGVASCAPAPHCAYQIPEQTDDGWATASLDDVGIDTPHSLASVSKSVTSALVGIAIDRGYIQDVDEPVFSYFPEYSHLTDEQKDRITLKHLLTMTSGLRWNELEVWLGDMRHDVVQLFLVPDPLRYILAKPVDTEPGTAWYYNGGGVCVLGNYATHEPVYEILTRYILPAVQ